MGLTWQSKTVQSLAARKHYMKILLRKNKLRER